MRVRWILLALVLLLGAFTARYVSLTPEGHHRFVLADGEVRDLPLVSPTLLGWILPGERAPIESAQYSPDGRWLYLSAIRGQGDQVASITLVRPYPGVLLVDLRLITNPIPGGRSAIGLLFGIRVLLDEPVYEGFPPITMDAGTDKPIVVNSFIP